MNQQITLEAGAERYLARLKKALAGIHSEEREEILTDIRSLIQEKLEAAKASGEPIEGILARLGPPEALADAYRLEGLLSEAANSSAPVVILKAALRWALVGVGGMGASIVLLTGYAMAIGFIIVAILKPLYPNQAGLWWEGGVRLTFGFLDTHGPAVHELLGYWSIPFGIVMGVILYVLTTRFARWLIRRARASWLSPINRQS